MKRQQILFGFLLIGFVFANQVWGAKCSPKADELDELMQSLNSALQQVANFSLLQRNQISSLIRDLQALQAKLDQLRSKMGLLDKEIKELMEEIETLADEINELKELKERMKDQLESKQKEIEGKEKAAQAQIKKIKDATDKYNDVLDPLPAILSKELTTVGIYVSAAKLHNIVTAISQDRSKAAKLLEAIKTNNQTSLRELLKQNSGGENLSIQEIKNTNGLGIVFKIGNIGFCLSTKTQCGGQSATVSK